MEVYVYVDGDHCDVEVFTKLKDAKMYAESCWPNDDGDLKWEKSRSDWLWGEYVMIHKREIK